MLNGSGSLTSAVILSASSTPGLPLQVFSFVLVFHLYPLYCPFECTTVAMAAKAVSRSVLPPDDRFVVGGVSSLAVLGLVCGRLVVVV